MITFDTMIDRRENSKPCIVVISERAGASVAFYQFVWGREYVSALRVADLLSIGLKDDGNDITEKAKDRLFEILSELDQVEIIYENQQILFPHSYQEVIRKIQIEAVRIRQSSSSSGRGHSLVEITIMVTKKEGK